MSLIVRHRLRKPAYVRRAFRCAPKFNPSVIPAGVVGAVAHPAVCRCLNYLARNFTQPIQIKDLVKISGMSRRGFIKAFEKHVGMKPGAMLRRVRLAHAKRLLTEKDLPLKAIAMRCGYRCMNSFCVAFSRLEGVAPKKYQKLVLLASHRQLQTKLKTVPALPN